MKLTAASALMRNLSRFHSELQRLRSVELLLLQNPRKYQGIPELRELFSAHHAHLEKVEAIVIEQGMADSWPELAELLEVEAVEVAA